MADRVKPWTQQYSPGSSKEVVGQDKAVASLKRFLVNYKREKKKAAILYGPTGSGKTCTVYALARELDLEVVELNASDVRNAEGIASIVGNASKQMSLFAKSKVILLDEIDGVSGTKDRGGIPELGRVVAGSAFPVLMTANDPFDKKFSDLRKRSVMMEFDPLGFADVFTILTKICSAEGMEFEEMALKSLARRCGGDARAAVNDLQMLSADKSFKMSDLEMLSDREKQEEITTALTKVFKTTDPLIALGAFDHVKEDLNQCMLWVDENLPKEYTKPADLARAYDFISMADVMNRRIRRWQHWRFMVYINAFLSAGVAVSKDEKYKKLVDYEQTQRLLKIYIANRKYNKRMVICEKIADRTHTSKKQAVQSTYPYLKAMFRKSKDKEAIESMADYLDLDKEEIEYLKR
ncbi:replication factor C large subunit [Candidatus Woesearchaeota archaeon]|nr:replication factor C large subunit [Candidatus Woesearchaeota archaeon]